MSTSAFALFREKKFLLWRGDIDLVKFPTIPTTRKPIKVKPMKEIIGVTQSEACTGLSEASNSNEA